MKKRLVVLVMVLLMVSATFLGCTAAPTDSSASDSAVVAETTEAPAAATSDDATSDSTSDTIYDVVWMAPSMSIESMAFTAKMFQKHMAEYGLNVTVMDNKGDPAVDAQNIQTAIAQGVKAIIINPNDPNAVVPSLMAAQKAGIVVCAFSGDLSEENQQYRDIYVGANDYNAGLMAGELFAKQFPDGATVVEIGGQAGYSQQLKRHDGFMKGIEGSKITVIDSQTSKGWTTNDAMNLMQDFIVKDGDQIQGVYCHWDNGLTGVIQALQNSGMDPASIYSVAIDGCKAGFDQVKNGTQTVSLMQNFETMAITAMQLVRQKLDGQDVEAVNYIQWDVVNKDTIDNFTYPEW